MKFSCNFAHETTSQGTFFGLVTTEANNSVAPFLWPSFPFFETFENIESRTDHWYTKKGLGCGSWIFLSRRSLQSYFAETWTWWSPLACYPSTWLDQGNLVLQVCWREKRVFFLTLGDVWPCQVRAPDGTANVVPCWKHILLSSLPHSSRPYRPIWVCLCSFLPPSSCLPSMVILAYLVRHSHPCHYLLLLHRLFLASLPPPWHLKTAHGINLNLANPLTIPELRSAILAHPSTAFFWLLRLLLSISTPPMASTWTWPTHLLSQSSGLPFWHIQAPPFSGFSAFSLASQHRPWHQLEPGQPTYYPRAPVCHSGTSEHRLFLASPPSPWHLSTAHSINLNLANPLTIPELRSAILAHPSTAFFWLLRLLLGISAPPIASTWTWPTHLLSQSSGLPFWHIRAPPFSGFSAFSLASQHRP